MNLKTQPQRLIVIGGNAAGMSAASKAKRLNPALEVVAFEKSPHVSYSACGIPYFVSDMVRDAADLVTLTAQEFEQKRGIDVKTRQEVADIDPVRHEIVAVDAVNGREKSYSYYKLLLGVGGTPSGRTFSWHQLPQVFTLQTLQDGISLKNFIDEKRPAKAVIIGGGYIAMEMAEALVLRNCDVHIVEKTAQILAGFQKDIVQMVGAELAKHKVNVYTENEVQDCSLTGDNGDSSVVVKTIQLDIPADLVLICTGLMPNTTLARVAGLRLGVTGAIHCDVRMSTSVPNIFAAGDCVEIRHLVSNKQEYIPLGTTANKQGRVAGENICGRGTRFPGVVGTSVFKVFGLEIAKTGLNVESASAAGFSPQVVSIREKNRAGYYSGSAEIIVTVVADTNTGRLLGAQMAGPEGISKRIDLFAIALTNKLTLSEMIHLDLSYAPPFAPVWDPVLVAVNVAIGKISNR